jgi:hypothetical protein
MTDTVEPSRATGRRRWLLVILAAAVVVVLVAVGLVGGRLLGFWGPDDDPAAQPTASPTPTGPPSPFAGTPAEDFAEGADGIELPQAEAVGDYTADQVAEALEQVREALIAARLDESMLVDHNPTAFLAALAPDHRPAQQRVFDEAAFAEFATQVAEDAQLAPEIPRVAGDLSYEAATAEGDLAVIEVTSRFVWVYAFETADDQFGGDLVVVRDELVWVFQEGYPWTEDSQGLWLADEAAGVWGADCDTVADGELLPDDDPVADLTAQAEMIFDPEQPLDAAGSC